MSKNNTIAILGSGNMGLYIAKGLSQSGLYDANSITLTRRNTSALDEYRILGFQVSNDNISATANADIIILGVLPQQLNTVLDEIASEINPDKHLIISIISGVSGQDIQKRLNKDVE